MGYLSGWGTRKEITLTGGSSGAQTDYQLKLAITHATGMAADFSDLRFTKADGTTLIDAWLESKVDSTSAVVWVEFPTTPVNGSTESYYMYYNNSIAAANWSGDDTFLLFDDFTGTSIDSTKWDVTGSVVVSGSEVALDNDDELLSKSTYGFGTAVAARVKANEQDIVFLSYHTDSGNRMELRSSDYPTPDEYAKIQALFRKSTAEDVILNQWSDFRNTYYTYEIQRIATNLMKYSQGSNSNSFTDSNRIVTGNMKILFDVWDSSQESTLICDWVAVRKCVENAPTYSIEGGGASHGAGSRIRIRTIAPVRPNTVRYI